LSENDKIEDGGVGAVRRRTGGRSARVREAVLQATLEVVAEQGLENLTFSDVGRRAGVHGTSVQRRWGSRENLFFEAIQGFAYQTIRIPDTGSLRSDLATFSRVLVDYFETPTGAQILRMLVAFVDNDPAFTANRAEYVRVRLDAIRAIFRRAAERGELRPGVEEDTALALMLGPIYFRLLISRLPADDAFIERATEILMNGLSA
jgi:AcrR family transcriptional regulator